MIFVTKFQKVVFLSLANTTNVERSIPHTNKTFNLCPILYLCIWWRRRARSTFALLWSNHIKFKYKKKDNIWQTVIYVIHGNKIELFHAFWFTIANGKLEITTAVFYLYICLTLMSYVLFLKMESTLKIFRLAYNKTSISYSSYSMVAVSFYFTFFYLTKIIIQIKIIASDINTY